MNLQQPYQDNWFDGVCKQFVSVSETSADSGFGYGRNTFDGNNMPMIASGGNGVLLANSHDHYASREISEHPRPLLPSGVLDAQTWEALLGSVNRHIVGCYALGASLKPLETILIAVVQGMVESDALIQSMWLLWKPTSGDGQTLVTMDQPSLAWLFDSLFLFTGIMRTSFLSPTTSEDTGNSDSPPGAGQFLSDLLLPIKTAPGIHFTKTAQAVLIANPSLLLGICKLTPLSRLMLNVKNHHPWLLVAPWAKQAQSYEMVITLASASLLFQLLISIYKIWISHRPQTGQALLSALNQLNALMEGFRPDVPGNKVYFKRIKAFVQSIAEYAEKFRLMLVCLASQIYRDKTLELYFEESVRASRACVLYFFIHRSIHDKPLENFNPYTKGVQELLETCVFPFCEQADLWMYQPETLIWKASLLANEVETHSDFNKTQFSALSYTLAGIMDTAVKINTEFLKFKRNVLDEKGSQNAENSNQEQASTTNSATTVSLPAQKPNKVKKRTQSETGQAGPKTKK